MRATPLMLAMVVLACAAFVAARPFAAPSGTHTVAWRVIVDDLHIGFTDTGRLRAMLMAVIDEALAHEERVSLRSTGPSGFDVSPTTDASELRPAARSATGNGLKELDVLRSWATLTNVSDAEPTRRARTAFGVMQSVVDAADRTAVVIVITTGPPASGPLLSAFDAVTTAARQRGVRILAADPRDHARLAPPAPPELASSLVNLHAIEAASLDRLATSTTGAVAHGLTETLAAMTAMRR